MTTPRRYASGTSVSVEKSEAELKTLLRKHGADRIVTGFDDSAGLAVVNFVVEGKLVRLTIQVPAYQALYAEAEKKNSSHWWRFSAAKKKEFVLKNQTQIARSRWRALILICKAKFEIIAEGMSTVEREFLADLVLPDGNTLHESISGKLQAAYLEQKMPKLLLGGI